MNQIDIFESGAPRIPRARSNGPITSQLAAAEGEKSGRFAGQMAQALVAVKERPGYTTRELSHYTGLTVHMLSRRLPDLSTVGKVRKGEPRPCAFGKRLAATWWPQ